MARAAVIGEHLRIYGYGLAGALLYPASDRPDAVRAWQGLPGDVAVVLLTARAATWLSDELDERPDILPVPLPDPGWAAAGTRSELSPLDKPA
jgi:vacuolar-type H+-ATPase subunit F/Vma7